MGSALGGIVEGMGAKAEADAAKNAAKFNARVAKEEGALEQERIHREGRRLASENITRVAKSGVRLEGSPLETLANNAANTERQLSNVRRATAIRLELAKVAKKNAEMAAKLAIAGSITSVISSVASFGLGGGAGGGAGRGLAGGQTFGQTGAKQA